MALDCSKPWPMKYIIYDVLYSFGQSFGSLYFRIFSMTFIFELVPFYISLIDYVKTNVSYCHYRLWTADARKTNLCTSWRGFHVCPRVSWCAPSLVSYHKSNWRCPRNSGHRWVPSWDYRSSSSSYRPRSGRHRRGRVAASTGPTRSVEILPIRAAIAAVRRAVPEDPEVLVVLVRPVHRHNTNNTRMIPRASGKKKKNERTFCDERVIRFTVEQTGKSFRFVSVCNT